MNAKMKFPRMPSRRVLLALAAEFIEVWTARGGSWASGKWEPAARCYYGWGLESPRFVYTVRAVLLEREQALL